MDDQAKEREMMSLRRINAEAMSGDRVRSLTRGEFDELPFGVIELDRDFKIRTYNASEAALARRARCVSRRTSTAPTAPTGRSKSA